MMRASMTQGLLLAVWVGSLSGCCKQDAKETGGPGGSPGATVAAAPACTDEGQFCSLPDGNNGICEQGRCKNPCKPGQFLYGGTHCAKACTGPSDCPGGSCEQDICVPLCPPACPYRW